MTETMLNKPRVKLLALVLVMVVETLLVRLSTQQGLHQIQDEQDSFSNIYSDRCQKISIELCEGIQYNMTMMPNLLGHHTQEQADMEAHQYMPLVKIQCSADMQIFLCLVFAPVCNVLEKPVPPCRSLCLSARRGCEPVIKKFGHKWPENLECDKFPMNENDQNTRCFVDNRNSTTQESYPILGHQYSPTIQSSSTNSFVNHSYELNFKCPLNLKSPPSKGYILRIHGKEHKDCVMPCDDLLLDYNDRYMISLWVGAWAIFCLIFSSFTIITYSIEPERFKFPERSIIFLSLCHFSIALVFVVGFFFGDSIACNEPFPTPVEQPNLQMVRSITQGNRNEKCTIAFMVLYFFTISNAIWWVVLTVTWFMTAALRWGHEPVEANSNCFHIFVWAISMLLTLIVLVMDKIEGDYLTGSCFIGIWNPSYTVAFVIFPLFAFLLIGFFFLVAGFVSLCRTRSLIRKAKNTLDITPLDKHMMRIGSFSLAYFLPTCVLLACFFYEQENVDAFMLYWLSNACKKPEYGIPCPPTRTITGLTAKKPHFLLYFIKYFAWLMPGISSAFWIWSGKTVSSWTRVFMRLFCMESRIDYV